jgi:hypothetical protein
LNIYRTARISLLFLLAVLAACASPLQKCVNRASGQLNAVRADIVRTAGNIDRGYAVHTQTVQSPQIGFCGGYGHHHDPLGLYVSGCRYPTYTRLETPVPINIEAEKQKLIALQERELALRAQTQPAVAACYGTYVTAE